MNAEIIAVGSELLTPQRIDTNSLYLTDQLNALGVEVITKSIVGDHRERLADSVRLALSRSEIIILTGGLGPTEDDVTRDAVAAALACAQQFRQDLCDAIEARFRRRGRAMAEINKRQANLIDGAEALPNANGTAPGQWIEHQGRYLMLLPGPPNELKPMFEEAGLPRLTRILPPQFIRTRTLRVGGLPESDVDARISPVYLQYENPVTTILAAAGDIQLHLRARCDTAEEAERLVNELAGKIEQLLGEHIYSRNGDPLEVVVGGLLRAREATLSVAESCTGGMLGERLTSVSGSSDYFLGGFLTYSDEIKVRLLGVTPEVLAEHTAVSAPVAEAMAAGARQNTASTYALSVTGLAGPLGGSEVTPVGTVFIGLAGPDGCHVRRFHFLGDRDRVRAWSTQQALEILRRRLLT